MRIAGPGENAIVIRDRDWFDKFNLSLDDIAKKIGKTAPKTRAYMFEINIWNDPDMYGEKKIKSQLYKRYTKNALEALRFIIVEFDDHQIWEKHKFFSAKSEK